MDVSKIDIYVLLRKRARYLKNQSNFFLVIIFSLIFFSGYIFFNADEITKKDLAQTNNNKLKEINLQLQKERENLQIIQNKIKVSREKEEKLFKKGTKKSKELLNFYYEFNKSIDKDLKDKNKYYGQVVQYYNIKTYLPKDMHSLFFGNSTEFQTRDSYKLTKLVEKNQNKLDFVYNELQVIYEDYKEEKIKNDRAFSKLEKLYSSDIRKIKNNISEYEEAIMLIRKESFKEKYSSTKAENLYKISSQQMIQTNITRFGTLILILFLVSLLIKLYRYNVRLSGYYDSRADSLLLIRETDIYKFERLSNVMTPENYDFGKIDSSPSSQTVELAKSILNKSKK